MYFNRFCTIFYYHEQLESEFIDVNRRYGNEKFLQSFIDYLQIHGKTVESANNNHKELP